MNRRRFHKFNPATVLPPEISCEPDPAKPARTAKVPDAGLAVLAALAGLPTRKNVEPAPDAADLATKRMAWLDAARNSRDKLAKRGYDYDGCGAQFQFESAESVKRVFESAPQFGRCDVCGEPADIVLHRDVTINGHKRFCAPCLRQQDYDREALGKRNKRKARTCPLCNGKWRQAESADGEEPACTTRNQRDIAHCLKYRFLLRELDADDLARPYVTTGPYCPWPQGEPDFAIRQDPRPETEQERAEIDRLAAMDADDGNDINGAARPVTAEPHLKLKESNHHGLSARTRSNQSG